MIQILPREGFRFDEASFLLFLKTLKSYSTKKPKGIFNTLKSLTSSKENFRFVIDCDAKGKVSFFFEELKQNTEVGQGFKQLVANDGNVIDVEVIEEYEVSQSLYFEPYMIDGTTPSNLKSYDPIILTYILNSMKPYTRIEYRFSVNSLSGLDLMYGNEDHVLIQGTLEAKCKTKYQRNDLKTLSNRIQDLLSGTGKLMVKYKTAYIPFSASSESMMNILSLPSIHSSDEQLKNKLYYLKRGERTLKEGEFTQGISIGMVKHPLYQNRILRVPFVNLKKHVFISGSTGAGKSAVIEVSIKDLLIQKIEGKIKDGMSFFDPAESSALGIINILRLLETEGYDISKIEHLIHYVDFSNDESVFSINLLDKSMNETYLKDYFRDLFSDTKTVQIDRILINCFSACINDKMDHTIYDVKRILKEPEYRLAMINRLSLDPYTVSNADFLKNELMTDKSGKVTDNMLHPILNRLDVFEDSVRKKRMFGSGRNDLKDVAKWLEEGHIIIYNMASLSNFDVKVIIGYIVTQYFNYGLTRVPYSNSHYIVVDECHKAQLSIYEPILAEMRKFGLHLWLMTQYLDQLNSDLVDSIMAQCDVKISLRQAEKGAVRIEKGTGISRDDLMSLPDLTGYLYTQGADKIYEPILFETSPPFRYLNGKKIDIKRSDFEEKIEIQTLSDRDYARNIMNKEYPKSSEIDKKLFKSKEVKQETQGNSLYG